MSGSVVVCVGNPFRRDDGVGPAVAELLRTPGHDGVRVVVLDGEPARIVEAWTGADRAVIVDAARSDAPAGSIRRLTVEPDAPLPSAPRVSSHAGSLREAVELGRVLGRLPARVVVLAVEGRDFAHGTGLSDPVAAAVPRVAVEVQRELGLVGGDRGSA